jgi:hypothetical protein
LAGVVDDVNVVYSYTRQKLETSKSTEVYFPKNHTIRPIFRSTSHPYLSVYILFRAGWLALSFA